MNADLEKARQRMIDDDLRGRGIRDPRVLAAMASVPRELFVPDRLTPNAYDDRPLPIGLGQTISQPYIVALMTEAAKLTGVERVLEVGTGSGYQAAVLARLAAEVVSIERHPELSRQAGAAMVAAGLANVTLVLGDGTLGWPELAPYDRILVTAAAPDIPPGLFDQLAEGGILVLPTGGLQFQTLEAVRKIDGRPSRDFLCHCQFVPLVGKGGWGVS